MKNSTKKFDSALEQFEKGKDTVAHRKAIKMLLSEVDLDEYFLGLLEEKDGVRDFFLLWTQAWKEEKDPEEKKGMKVIATSSKKFYKQKEYGKLCEFFYGILFRHLAELIHLEERKDFETITDHDLHTKRLIPSEIFFQYFLIEILVKSKVFNWDRGEEIANQNLACFITCFDDIYKFFHEEEEKSGVKPKCGLCGKPGNLQKTDCCDNWICNDSNDYVVFSYARNSCSRNHSRFTLCGSHRSEEHKGDWKTCKKCLENFELEMYVWYGTNEYNFEKLENPPKFPKTHCAGCKKVLSLPDGGFSSLGNIYVCDECEEQGFDIRAVAVVKAKKL